MVNALNWFEIPTVDIDRAAAFYGAIFDAEIVAFEMYPGFKMAMLPYEQGKGVGGAIVHGEGYTPSTEGSIVYLNGGADLSVVLDRIAPAGGTSGNILRGNLIGTDVTGNSTIPNFGSGIDINNSSNNTIGGTAAGQRNIICGNFTNGITMFSNANSNVVQGNRIGVGAGGAALGNANQSIRMHLANNNTIGGTTAGAGNIIGNNGNGVIVLQSTGDSIRGNSISGIGGLGIDLDDNGQTANDAGDGDSGGNNDQNYPVLTSALTSMSSTMVAFTLNSQAGTTFGIDFYRNTACDGSGFGEGEVYLGSTSAMTDGSGNVSAFANLPAIPVGSVITATATDPSGNTSEFSACIVTSGVADPAAVWMLTVASPSQRWMRPLVRWMSWIRPYATFTSRRHNNPCRRHTPSSSKRYRSVRNLM